ncbi:hypothetical protein [Streptomyces venetus]|uniref:hypothetical protein n=1 Tax=Streptomyces venetus TaxID=1701086 RepID=UPI003C308C7C
MADDSRSDAGTPPASLTTRLTTAVRSFFASPIRRDAAAILAGLASGGVGAVVGAAELPVWVAALGTVLVTALFLLIERAAAADTADEKVKWLWGALAVALALPAGSWGYHVLFDSGDRSEYAFYLEGDRLDILESAGRPGGPQISGWPLRSGKSHNFECTARDPEGRLWLKAVAGNYWYEAARFSPVGDFTASDMPTCE